MRPILGDQLAQRMRVQNRRDVRRHGRGKADRRWAALVAYRLGGIAQQSALGSEPAGQSRCGPLEELGALGEHELDVDLRWNLHLRGMPPGADGIGPALDRERPFSFAVRGELGEPAVAPRLAFVHSHPLPDPAGGIAEADRRRNGVMALAEHVRGDLERLSDDGLGEVTSAPDHGFDVEDRDASGHVPKLASRSRK